MLIKIKTIYKQIKLHYYYYDYNLHSCTCLLYTSVLHCLKPLTCLKQTETPVSSYASSASCMHYAQELSVCVPEAFASIRRFSDTKRDNCRTSDQLLGTIKCGNLVMLLCKSISGVINYTKPYNLGFMLAINFKITVELHK